MVGYCRPKPCGTFRQASAAILLDRSQRQRKSKKNRLSAPAAPMKENNPTKTEKVNGPCNLACGNLNVESTIFKVISIVLFLSFVQRSFCRGSLLRPRDPLSFVSCHICCKSRSKFWRRCSCAFSCSSQLSSHLQIRFIKSTGLRIMLQIIWRLMLIITNHPSKAILEHNNTVFLLCHQPKRQGPIHAGQRRFW